MTELDAGLAARIESDQLAPLIQKSMDGMLASISDLLTESINAALKQAGNRYVGDNRTHLPVGSGTEVVLMHRIGILVATVVLFATGPGQSQEARPVRVGVLGIDNYQSVAFAQIFNDPKAKGDLAGVRVVAAWAGSASEDIPESRDSLAKWKEQIVKFDVKLVDSVEQLLGQSDAVMIMSLDGRKHREQATAVLKAGKPLFVGRPLAATLTDARAILRLAAETKTPFWTSSQHRFSPGFAGMRNHAEVGTVLGCDVYGGCPFEPHHADLFWHGLHGIETLNAIMGPGCTTVTCVSTPVAESVTGVWSDGRVGTFRGIKKGAIKYSATVFGDKGVSVAGIYGHGVPVKGIVPTNDRYMGYEGIAIEIARFFKGGPAPVSAAETLEIFGFMEAAHESKRQGGAAVRISDILGATKR